MPSASKSGPRAPPAATPSSCSITCPDQPLVRTRPTGTGSPSASASAPSSTPTRARACASSASRSDLGRLDLTPRPDRFRGNVPPVMDEARIQEIVDRVIARIGELPETPMEAVQEPAARIRAAAPAARAEAPRAPARGRHPARAPGRVPRRRRGREGGAPRARGRTRRRRWRRASAGSRSMREAARKLVPALARYAVEETGYGRVDDKLKKNTAVRRQDAGAGGAAADRLVGRRRPDADRARQLRRHRIDHADHQPDRDDHQQRHRHGGGRQRGGVQRPPVRGAHVGVPDPPVQRRDRGRGRAGEPAHLRRAADDRERRDADALPGRAPAGRHGRPGRGQGGDGQRQEGDRGRAGQPARRRRRDRRPRRRRHEHRAGRVDRQQHPLHRGEGDRRGRVDRGRAAGAAGAARAAWS